MADLITSAEPVGTIKTFAGTVPPVGYFVCEGDIVLGGKTSYPALYAVIGDTYAQGGEGAGDFRLPDFRGRSPIGHGQGTYAGATNRVRGQPVGAETHTLTKAQMPAHNHGGGGHTHPGTYAKTNLSGMSWAVPATGADVNYHGTISTSGVIVGVDGGDDTTANGNATAHANMQPSLVVKFIIKF